MQHKSVKVLPKNVQCRYFGNESKRRFRQKMKKYCEETTLHGLRYLTKTSKYQSLFWYLICSVSFTLCVLFIYYQMIRYRDNRVSTTITTTNYPVWKVPFPSVTICNSNVIYRSHTEEIIYILEKYKIPINIIESYFHNLSLVILNDELSRTDLNLENSIQITKILEREGYDTEKLMDRLAQPCTSMLRKCEWKATAVDCSTMFEKIKTTGGFCCSFNYQGVHSKDKSSSVRKDIFAGGVGSSYGLKVYLDVEKSQNLLTKQNSGFRVLVQNPRDYPDLWIYGADLDVESKISISIKPMILSSSEELRKIDMENRGCLFSDEVNINLSLAYVLNDDTIDHGMLDNLYEFDRYFMNIHDNVI